MYRSETLHFREDRLASFCPLHPSSQPWSHPVSGVLPTWRDSSYIIPFNQIWPFDP